MTEDEQGRRRFLYRAGSVAALGVLAGCAGGDGSASGGAATDTGTETERTTTVRVDAETEAPAAAGSNSSSPYLQPAPRTVDQFLANANFYNGNMVVGVPLVAVGAGQEELGFDPAAIKVSTGTEVTWEWASGEKPHNVVQIAQVGTEEVAFDSGAPQKGTEITYSYTFEEPGIYRYVCTPHRDQGARGAVVVEEGPIGASANESG